MRALTMSLIFTVLAVSATAQAADQVNTTPTTIATPATSIAAPVDDGDKIICRNEAITGSHFTQKVCAKKSQWEHVHNASVDSLERNTERSLQGVPGPGGAGPGSPSGTN